MANPSYFYAVILFAIGISLLVGYGSILIVSFFALLFNMFFGYLVPTSVSILIYLIFALSWGKVFYDIFASKKAA